jgi:hypothetical protein
MAFSSIDDIAQAFSLYGHERAEIRRHLRERQATIHPDRNSGTFSSLDAKNEFHRIEEAISLLDAPEASTALVPIAAIPQIVRALRDAIAPEAGETRQDRLAERLDVQIERSVQHFRAPHSIPRVTLAGVSAVLTAIWAFPTLLSGNPALARVLDPSTSLFLAVWVYALGFTTLTWFVAWSQKDRHDRLVSALKSEPHQNRLFRDFIRDQRQSGQSRVFSKDDLVDVIRHPVREYTSPLSNPIRDFTSPLRRLFAAPEIDYETAQTVADLLIGRLEARGVVELIKDRSLSATYRLVESPGD